MGAGHKSFLVRPGRWGTGAGGGSGESRRPSPNIQRHAGVTMSTRGGNGQFERDLATAERDAEACRLRARGRTYQQIAAELGMYDKSGAYAAVQRALIDTVKEPADEVRQLELIRLDEMHRAALGVMEATHYVVDKGAVVLWDDEPLIDDGPVLAAIDRLLRIQDRRAKLLGLDSPQRVSVDAQNLGEDITRLIGALMSEEGDDDDEPDDEDPDEDGEPNDSDPV